MSRARDDSGTAIVEFVWLAVLLLIPLVYVVLGVFEVQRAAYAASTAARSAGRAFVTSPSEAAARPRAQSAARLAFEDQGLAGAPLGLEVTCSPSPTNCLAPGSVVSIEVRSSVALPSSQSSWGVIRHASRCPQCTPRHMGPTEMTAHETR
ncbi:MAG: hypothetical protein V9E81_03940 [Marmoricola sp.]